MLKIGILGGGQLARMLALAGHNLGYEMHVLSSEPVDPAAIVTRHWFQGDVSDQPTLNEFFKSVDLILIESEFLDEQKLQAAEAASGKAVTPTPRLIGELQDRLKQKAFFERIKIPTAPFTGLSSAAEAEHFFRAHKKGIVLKKRRFGYDGYGTFLVSDVRALNRWIMDHGPTAADFIAEQKVQFKRELAMTMSITEQGDVLHFPLVEWKARDAKCYWVKGPVKHPKAEKLRKTIAAGLVKAGYVGIVTFELFDTGKDLLVNEVAPRVHNSAHYSIDALTQSQFTVHLLSAVSTLHEAGYLDRAHLQKSFKKLFAPIAPPELITKGFAMLNLIGTSTDHPVLPSSPQSETHRLTGQRSHRFNGRLHWYGKTHNRAGRKMGHVTVLDSSAEKALKKVLRFEKMFKL